MGDGKEIKLNSEQKRAVEFAGGPLLIVAGAGTGKTRVITEKIKYLISDQGFSPRQILALTFTEKAAEEMLDRVDIAMPLGYEQPWLSTFHSFCDQLLREEALEIGLDPAYKILTPPQAWIFVRETLFSFDLNYYRPLGNPTKFISAMLTLFSRAQDEAVTPVEYVSWATAEIQKEKSESDREEMEKQLELANAYQTYQALKIKHSYLDFGDLILWVLKLFEKRPAVLEKYRNQFKYFLVDEFQDTNYAQYCLLKTLAPAEKDPNLMVVGDDDQSIYKFRGAAVSNILSFKTDYPDAETITLVKNYRTGQRILDHAYQLIQHNNPDRLEQKVNVNKELESKRGMKAEPQVIGACNETEEAEEVVGKIVDLVQGTREFSWRDSAILARARNHLDPFVSALKRRGIPYQLVGNRGLFDQDEVRDMHAFLRLMNNPEDSISLYRLLVLAVFDLPSKFVFRLSQLAKQSGKSLWQVVKENQDQNNNLANLIGLIEQGWQDGVRKPPTVLLYNFATQSGYVQNLLEEESIENQLKIRNLNLFFEKIKLFESEASSLGKKSPGVVKDVSVTELVNYLDLLLEAGESPAQAEIQDVDTVNLMTVHAAKGLEFPVVFLVDLVKFRFPTRNRSDKLPLPDVFVKEELPEGNEHIQEERRLFYVGCTRAKDYLFLTWARDYGGKAEKKPSLFIKELGLETGSKGSERKVESIALFEEAALDKQRKWRIENSSWNLSTLSHSQLETFATCPLQYKYRYVLKLPERPEHTLSFGQTIHRTLRDFHRTELFSEKRDLDYLLDLYNKHWIPFGYTSPEHMQTRYAEGKDLLRNYYDNHKNLLREPLYLEKKFTLKIEGVSLLGSIDRVDRTDQGIEIIDYKTGKAKSQKKVDKDSQLTIYALAAREALGLEADLLSLYFVEHNKKVVTTRKPEQLSEKREEIAEEIQKINAGNFPPHASYACRWCSYNEICPAYKGESY